MLPQRSDGPTSAFGDQGIFVVHHKALGDQCNQHLLPTASMNKAVPWLSPAACLGALPGLELLQ